MQAPLQKKTEIKVYILYVMKNIGYPVEYDKLNDAITMEDPVTAFAFTECFSELLDTENIELIRGDDGSEAFMITQKGINVCDNLLYMLIPSVQRIALSTALRFVSFEQKGMDFSCTVTNEEGHCLLSFAVTQKDKQIFSMELSLSDVEQASRFEEKLKKNPEFLYKSILALLDSQRNFFV